MKTLRLLFLLLTLSISFTGCSHGYRYTSDSDGFDYFSIRLDDIAGSVDIGLDIETSDLCVDDIELAIAILDQHIDGESFSKKELRDSVEYIKRFVESINHETWELNEMFNDLF